jgi:TonB family protein
MATTEVPPNPPIEERDEPSKAGGTGVLAENRVGRKKMAPVDEEEFHFLISELEDENSRGRLREALWISIIVHMIVIFTVKEGPKFAPNWFARQPHLATTAELMKQRELTFTELPPDAQRLKQRPDTNKISDKDRIATSRAPEITKRALDAVRDNRRTMAPGAGPTPQPTQPQQPQQQTQASPQQQQQQQRQTDEQIAKLNLPAEKPNFNIAASPGALIEQAARASAANRSGGAGGDLGGGPGTRAPHVGNLDILSDTMGVDFGPYLQRVLQAVRTNWYAIIPEVAQSPLRKQGRVAIEFVITKSGAVAGMRLVGPSGDVALDRAAWGGITGSNPFPPLPTEFRGDNLALRFRFYYNPGKNDLQ